MRALLVTLQIAASVVLLMGTNLLLTTVRRLHDVDPGFAAENRVSFRVAAPAATYPDGPARSAFFDELLSAIRDIPGVEDVSMVSALPLTGSGGFGFAWLEGQTMESGILPPPLQAVWAAGDYFDVMDIPLLRGRTFDASDRPDARPVAVISESLADRLWPGRDPIGRRFQMSRIPGPNIPWRTVVGLVGDVRDADLSAPPRAAAYYPFEQNPRPRMYVTASVRGEIPGLAAAIRMAVRSVDPGVPVYEYQPVEAVLDASTALRRYSGYLIGAFAGLVLVLACTGLYSLLSYAVAERRREIGVRMAFGATGIDVLSGVFRRVSTLVLIGLGVGLACAVVSMRLIAGMLYGVTPSDPGVLLVTSGLVATVAMVAAVVPARRAAAVEPLTAIRE